jgi:hypothetical protein
MGSLPFHYKIIALTRVVPGRVNDEIRSRGFQLEITLKEKAPEKSKKIYEAMKRDVYGYVAALRLEKRTDEDAPMDRSGLDKAGDTEEDNKEVEPGRAKEEDWSNEAWYSALDWVMSVGEGNATHKATGKGNENGKGWGKGKDGGTGERGKGNRFEKAFSGECNNWLTKGHSRYVCPGFGQGFKSTCKGSGKRGRIE